LSLLLRNKGVDPSALKWRVDQGCQIFLGTTYQNGKKYTEILQNIPNGQKIFQNGRTINQIYKKYTTLSISKPSNTYPNWDF
jgi:hypothetical protein